MDPYSGLARLPSDFRIPEWQKGDKLSDSGEDLGDSSSDASGFLAAEFGDESGSDIGDSDSESETEAFAAERDLNSTPKAERIYFKGKDRAVADSLPVLPSSPVRPSPFASSLSGSAKYTATIRSRPRSNSRPAGIAPGPAAQMFSNFSQSSSLPSLPGPRSADLLSKRGLRSGFEPRAKPARGMDRAISAPTNLFGGSPPIVPKQKGLKGKQATTAPLSADPDTEEDDLPSSPVHSAQSIIDTAMSLKQNSVDLRSDAKPVFSWTVH